MSYTIEQNIIQGLPGIPFRNGVGNYEGVVNHCTDSPNHSGGDTPTGERNYEAKTFNSAFVHFFIGVENGQAKIEQVASTSYIAYGAGHTSNQRYLHLELDMYDDPGLFKLAYDAYVWLTAKLLADRKLGVTDKGSLWSHAEISNTFKETDHQDPISYLSGHGISWSQHVANVTAQYNAMTAPPAPTPVATHVPNEYVVQPGDNLTNIAKKFATTVAELEKLNNISNPSLIHPGQILVISEVKHLVTLLVDCNLREQPSLTAKILRVLPKGSSWIVNGEENGFYNVGGWVTTNTKYVTYK